MFPRHYLLVCDDNDKTRNPRIRQEKSRQVSAVTEDYKSNMTSKFKCEVTKSPRAPEYEIHMVRSKSEDYERLPISVSIKKRPRQNARKPGEDSDRKHRTDSECTATSDNDSRLDSDVTEDKENKHNMGIRVIACYNKDGLYYPGHVNCTVESVYAMVTFNFKKKQKVRTQMMIPISGAIPMPELARGDFVLVRVNNQARQLECYVPGIIEHLPDPRQTPRFFTVLMYNGQTATTMRRYIIKIGQARFDMAVKYIAHIQQAKQRCENMKSSPRSQRSDSIVSDSQSETRAHKHSRRHSKTRDRHTDKESGRSAQSLDRSTSQSEQSDRTLTDDGASNRSSQRSGHRKKKEKYTKRIAKTKEAKQRSNSRKKSRSRSSSGSRSRSYSRSQSESRSVSSRSRSRSRSVSPSSSRTRSSCRSRSSGKSYSRSRSRSRSSSRSRSRSRSRESIRSFSSGSRSRSESRTSRSSSRSGSRTPTQRSKVRMVNSKPRTRSSSNDRSGSTTPRNSPIERPSNPVPGPRPVSPPLRTNSIVNNITRSDIYGESRSYDSPGHSRMAVTDEKDQVITDLQYQLEKQKRKQLRQEQRLVRQARKINKIQNRLSRNNDSMHSDKSKSVRSSSDDTDTSPQRRKGSPDGVSCRENSDLIGVQRSLPGLRKGHEVLARWVDDGWYYHGCVEGERGDNCYVVCDAAGHMEQIGLDDILTEEEHKLTAVQPEDYIIGLHPKYVFSYAPAEVLDTYINGRVKVEFYDGCLYTLPSEEIYSISKAKYESDVKYIIEREKRLVGRSVIARDDETGAYKLGVVDSHCGMGQHYYVKWLDGMLCKQNANHIFEVGQHQRPQGECKHVLAPVDQSNRLYKPAKVMEDSAVIFCDGTRSFDVRLEQCFWLNKRYYKNAIDFYQSKN